jgi:hypothetical protein
MLPLPEGVVAPGKGTKLSLDAPVPILKGDKISMVGGKEEAEMGWDYDGRILMVDVGAKTDEELRSGWVLKVEYRAGGEGLCHVSPKDNAEFTDRPLTLDSHNSQISKAIRSFSVLSKLNPPSVDVTFPHVTHLV